MWHPGKGYQIQDAWPVICISESPINAYLDYLLYEQTSDRLWRERAFQMMEFVKRAQHTIGNRSLTPELVREFTASTVQGLLFQK